MHLRLYTVCLDEVWMQIKFRCPAPLVHHDANDALLNESEMYQNVTSPLKYSVINVLFDILQPDRW